MTDGTITLTRGIPASGKTTWALEQVRKSNGKIKRVAKDDLRLMSDGSQLFGDAHAFVYTQARNALIETYLGWGFSVIVDETFVVIRDIDDIFRQFRHTEIFIEDFSTVPLTVCIERDSLRPKPLGERVLKEYHDILEGEGDYYRV